jgi:AraC-like DNA-binding protein
MLFVLLIAQLYRFLYKTVVYFPDTMKPAFSDLPLIRLSSRYSSRKFPLHALTILSGHSRETSPDYYNDGMKTEVLSYYAVWQYTISGRGRIECREGKKDLLPGSLMIVSVPGPHVYYLPEDSDHWEFVFLVMIGREAIRIVRMIERQMGHVLDADKTPETVVLLYDILSKLFSEEINDPFGNSCRTYRLCMKFLEEAGAEQGPERQSFDELKTFLKNNLYRDISVEEMAEVLRLSRSHFTRLFSREMGMSPRMYLEDLRLKTAMGLLFEDQVSVKEAAVRCGIYDVNYFCRLFRKRYGISPGKYKERELRSAR